MLLQERSSTVALVKKACWINERIIIIIHFHQDFNTETFTQSRTASCLHFI